MLHSYSAVAPSHASTSRQGKPCRSRAEASNYADAIGFTCVGKPSELVWGRHSFADPRRADDAATKVLQCVFVSGFVAQQGSLAVCRLHYVCAQLRSTHHYLPGRDEIMVAESKRYGAVGDEAAKQLQGPRPVGRAHDLPLCAWHAHSRTRSQQLAGSALRSGCWCTSWGVHRCSIT